MKNWIKVGVEGDFEVGGATATGVGSCPIAVVRQEKEWFALHDLCTHGHARLSDGYVEDNFIECPLHQGTFELKTGAPLCAPVTQAVRTYPIRVVDGVVEIEIDCE